MHISKKKNYKKITAAIILLLAITLCAGIYVYGVKSVSREGINTPTDSTSSERGDKKDTQSQEEQYNADQKQKFNDTETTNEKDSPLPKQVPTADNISLSAQSDGPIVTIVAKLTSVSSGTCSLIITNRDKTHTDTATVIYQPEYSSCAGFTVKKELLGSGTWLVKLSVKTQASTIEKTIIYEV